MNLAFRITAILLILIFVTCQKKIEPIPENLIELRVLDGHVELNDGDSLYINRPHNLIVEVKLNEYNSGNTIDFKLNNLESNSSETLNSVKLNNGRVNKSFSLKEKGNAFIEVEISGSGYKSRVNLVVLEDPIDSILNLRILDTTILADGNSILKVEAELPYKMVDEVSFKTSRGKFLNGSGTITKSVINSNAVAYISLDQSISPYFIECSTTNYNNYIRFTPNPARPDNLSIIPNKWSIDSSGTAKNTNNVQFEVLLERSVGQVSEGIKIKPEAFQIVSGKRVNNGTFYDFPIVSNSKETAVVQYYPEPRLSINELLYIVFSTTDNTGKVIADTVKLHIN